MGKLSAFFVLSMLMLLTGCFGAPKFAQDQQSIENVTELQMITPIENAVMAHSSVDFAGTCSGTEDVSILYTGAFVTKPDSAPCEPSDDGSSTSTYSFTAVMGPTGGDRMVTVSQIVDGVQKVVNRHLTYDYTVSLTAAFGTGTNSANFTATSVQVGGTCKDGAITVQLPTGTTMTPSTIACATGTYSFTANFSGAPGDKLFSLSQGSGSSAASASVTLTYAPVLGISAPLDAEGLTDPSKTVLGTCTVGAGGVALAYAGGASGPATTVCTDDGSGNGSFTVVAAVGGAAGARGITVTQNGYSITRSFTYVPQFRSALSTSGLQLSASYENTCAMKGHTLYCWGPTTEGRLGDGAVSPPANINKPTNEVKRTNLGLDSVTYDQVGVGWSASCALATNKKIYCWGSGTNGDKTASNVPLEIDMSDYPGEVFKQVAVGSYSSGGYEFACGLTESKKVYCWGYNGYGQLGDGTTTSQPLLHAVLVKRPTTADAPNYTTTYLSDIDQITLGENHACALTVKPADGVSPRTLWCWGYNGYAQLGDETWTSRSIPTKVHRNGMGPPSEEFTQVSAGTLHTCAVSNLGYAYCWGYNGYGQLGIGSTTTATYPSHDPTTTNYVPTFTKVFAGGYSTSGFSCGIATPTTAHPATVYCWGYNAYNELGNNTVTNQTEPTPMVFSSGTYPTIQEMALGGYHGCARTDNDETYCWGWYAQGQLGIGPVSAAQATPFKVTFPQ